MSKRILVVEDQEDNRQILRDLLGSAGYEMTEAWDGEASVSAAKEQRPDLILMDIQLPLMDGYSWLVERFFAWIQWQRRILVRWEFHTQNFLGFVQLACLVILFRQF